jgi:hypothetical protein
MAKVYSKHQNPLQHELHDMKPYEKRLHYFIENNLENIAKQLFETRGMPDGEYFWMGLTKKEKGNLEFTKVINTKVVKIKDMKKAELICIRTVKKWENGINDEMLNLCRRGVFSNKFDRGQKFKKLKGCDNVVSRCYYDIVGFYIQKKPGFNLEYRVLLGGYCGKRYYIRTTNKGGKQQGLLKYRMNVVKLFEPATWKPKK